MKNIPHLQLPITFGVEPLVEDYKTIQHTMVGYELPGEDRTDEERAQYRRNWKGRGLIDFDTDSTKAMLDARSYKGANSPFDIKYDEQGRAVYFTTDLGRVMSSYMEVINQLFEHPGRCRITSMAPGGGLNWHSHCQFRTGNYEEHADYDLAIVHVPIITNPGVKFGVAKFEKDRTDHRLNPVWQHYAAGECWLLNAWHEHNVVNEGDESRIHLMMYGSLRDPKLAPLIIEGLRGYDGPVFEG